MIRCMDTKETFTRYSDYLKSNHWNKIKTMYKNSDRPKKCGICESKGTLDLHHITYERVGNELLSDLIYLCRTCHEKVHEIFRQENSKSLNDWIKSIQKLKGIEPSKETNTPYVEMDTALEFNGKALIESGVGSKARKYMERYVADNVNLLQDDTLKQLYEWLLRKEKTRA